MSRRDSWFFDWMRALGDFSDPDIRIREIAGSLLIAEN